VCQNYQDNVTLCQSIADNTLHPKIADQNSEVNHQS
jgi:hypothetical protein